METSAITYREDFIVVTCLMLKYQDADHELHLSNLSNCKLSLVGYGADRKTILEFTKYDPRLTHPTIYKIFLSPQLRESAFFLIANS